jgi:glycosyltransferase involved in cell wall biosynthesis
MKHKKAIVCTDVGCVRQYLVDGQHVLLIPPKDDAKLIHAIIKLENAELRRMLGENACNFVEANLSLGECAERIHELLIRETES